MERWETLKGEAQTAAKEAREIAEKADQRELTEDEQNQFQEKSDLAQSKKEESDRAKADADRMNSVLSLTNAENEQEKSGGDVPAKSLGSHVVKNLGSEIKNRGTRYTLSSSEFTKDSGDTHVTGGHDGPMHDVLTEVDKNIVQGKRRRLTIADLLGSGNLSGQAITYFVEGDMEGDFETVGEGDRKPQIHFKQPEKVTEALSKVAGFIKESDEMTEDLPFLVSAIDDRLLYQLGLFEEDQLLAGNGSGTNLKGLLNRDGINEEEAEDDEDRADAIFRGMTQVSLNSGLDVDGIVINPMDYQALRLSRDSNGQYYGGGFFAGQYGTGDGVERQLPLWGMNTVVTPAIDQGTVLVGSYAQAATVYRKGGTRVEMTNSNDTDFEHNLVTIRAEERLALAVRKPSGFTKVDLSSGSGN